MTYKEWVQFAEGVDGELRLSQVQIKLKKFKFLLDKLNKKN